MSGIPGPLSWNTSRSPRFTPARLIACDRHALAIQRARQLVQSNPLLEEAHARLAWLYAQTGQRAAALQQFERCRDLYVAVAAEFCR